MRSPLPAVLICPWALRVSGVPSAPPLSPSPSAPSFAPPHSPPAAPQVQEFGVCEVRDLKPNGANVLVTEENKKEYVHLVCQMRMTGEAGVRVGGGAGWGSCWSKPPL